MDRGVRYEKDIKRTENALKAVDRALKLVDAVKWDGTVDIARYALESKHSLTESRENLIKLLGALGESKELFGGPVKLCRCKGTDNSGCEIHTISHYHRPGCCEEPEEAHRHMTGEEYDREFPLILDKTVTVGDERYNIECRRFWDGDGVTVTRLVGDDKHGGLCFDFSVDALPALLPLLQELLTKLEDESSKK